MPALRTVSHLGRAALTAALLAAATLGPAQAAQASTAQVEACATSDDGRSDAWVPTASTGQPVEFFDHCTDGVPAAIGPVDVTGRYGFSSDSPAPNPPLYAAPGRVIGYTVTAPTDATIRSVLLDSTFAIASADFEIRVRAGATVLATCAGPTTATLCADGLTPATDTPITLPAGTTSLDVAAYCVALVRCGYVAGNQPTFTAGLRSASITLDDPDAPTVNAPTPGDKDERGRITQASTITVSGSDPAGIRTLEVLEGTSVIGRYDGHCVDWSMRLCAEPSIGAGTSDEATFSIKELGLAAGTHTLRTRATDGAGNVVVSDPTVVIVDETVLAPTGLAGFGPSSQPIRELRWAIPPGMLVASAKVELCPVATPGRCTLVGTPAEGPYSFSSETYPDVVARVRFTTPGGATAWSEPVSFAYDTTPPKQPVVNVVEKEGALRVVELVPNSADQDAVRYVASICAMPGGACSPLDSGPLPTDGSRVRVSTRLTSLMAQRVDIAVIDLAGNQSLPGQVILTPTAADLKIKKNAAPMSLVPKLPAKLPKSSVVVKGAVPAGAAAKVTVTITGRTKKGKAAKASKVARLDRSGAFAVRVKLPGKLNRKKGVLVTIAATPAEGFLAAKVRQRLKG